MGWRAGLMALALAGLSALAGPARAKDCSINRDADLPVTMSGMRPVIPVKIDGKDARLLLDTGAYINFLGPGAAARLGLKGERAPVWYRVQGLNGTSGVTVATADLVLGGSRYPNRVFMVDEAGVDSGHIDGVLGATFLTVEDLELDLANAAVRVFSEKHCDNVMLAYWAGERPYSVLDLEKDDNGAPTAYVFINGQKVRAMFDTGSTDSLLDKAVAARLGVKPGGPDVVESGVVRGSAPGSFEKSWVGPFDSFKIGDEEIKHTRLRFGDVRPSIDVDMLIGTDFLLSHRVFISRPQRRMFFTYNGGPVFDLGAPPPEKPSEADPGLANAPTDADGYRRRGIARMDRRDYASAIADFDRAIELDPKNPQLFQDRATAHIANGEAKLSLADFDQALTLKPDSTDVLLARAGVFLLSGQRDKARADLAAADKIAAKDSDLRMMMAGYYENLGDYGAAVAQADQWVDTHPKDDKLAEALNERCWFRAQWGEELDKGLEDCNQALKLDPGHPAFLDSRGLVRLRRGEYDKAIRDYQAALQLTPKSAHSLYGRGLAEVKSGQKAAGDADIAAAVALDPKLPDWAKGLGLTP